MNPESNDPKNSKNPLDNMPKGNIWTALIITLALVLLISWIYGSISNSQYTQTSVSDFLKAVEEDNLSEVEFRYDRVIYLTRDEAVKEPARQKAC